MSQITKKRKAKDDGPRARKRGQMVLAPPFPVQPILSDTSTIPYDCTQEMDTEPDLEVHYSSAVDDGPLLSDEDDVDSLDGDDGDPLRQKTTDPLRSDMPIKRTRWEKEETDALMTALNVDRDAIKFHFDGPGGGRDVKRQAWLDVATYVNDVANTHRTVQQCRNKADDYTQRVKGKYNRLRHAISQTGRGKIKDGMKLKETENKALDYLREEAVRGIPGIKPMSLGGPKLQKPSKKNRVLLWDPKRETKPDYAAVDMPMKGVPKNYKEKNNRRVARDQKAKRKIEHKRLMLKERAEERKTAKEIKVAKEKEKEMKVADEIRKERKDVQARLAERQKRRKERVERRKEKEDRREEKAKKKKEERRKRREARRERREARRLKRKEKKNGSKNKKNATGKEPRKQSKRRVSKTRQETKRNI